MPDEVKVNEECGIIEIRSYGEVTKEDIAHSIAEVCRLNLEKGINKVVVDTTEQEQLPGTMGMYELFSLFPRDLRVALVSEDLQPTARDIHFIETVAQNRGIKIRVFPSKEESLNWLGLRSEE